ncbi:MAG: ABC transporter substrate-binding protein [Actinobacteria bacterium]|nr:ABC transporter substrate-binding protein [Actinomycetota bacterium]
MTRGTFVRALLATTAGVSLVAGLTACSEDRTADTNDDAAPATTAAANVADCPNDIFACAMQTSLADLLPEAPTTATGEPIVLGMINQENTPVGSYPELSSAATSAAAMINEYFGGVNGRPIQIEVCNTQFSPEGSTSCAQKFVEQGVPAVLGGIDVFGTGISTLEENGIPFIGGVPVSFTSVKASNSFQWSGGSWGATIAFAHHAAENGAKKVAVAYPEFESSIDGAMRAKSVLEAAGVTEIQMIPYPVTATDMTSPIQAAASTNPDALIMLAADMGCAGTFDGVATVGITAQVYVVGACASPTITKAAGPEKTNGVIFNVEGVVEGRGEDMDFALYSAAAAKYGNFDPVGAGTVSFRSFINLWSVLLELDEITPDAIMSTIKSKTDAPSFMGHPYTCDGSAMPDFPAMCAPQEILVQMRNGELTQITDWIDVGKLPGVSL